jgi:hypothetical protein
MGRKGGRSGRLFFPFTMDPHQGVFTYFFTIIRSTLQIYQELTTWIEIQMVYGSRKKPVPHSKNQALKTGWAEYEAVFLTDGELFFPGR